VWRKAAPRKRAAQCALVAATGVGVRRPRNAKNMDSGPKDNRVHGPACGEIGNIEVWDGNKASQQLCQKRVEQDVDEQESEADAGGESPVGAAVAMGLPEGVCLL
jgi:hypothetical protein